MNALLKTLFILLLSNLLSLLLATTFTIGTGTSTTRRPIASYYPYECCASLYLANEIGYYGSISDLSWFPTYYQTVTIPTKIYLKSTTATTMTTTTWTNLISDATLVFDGTVTDFTGDVWKTIDINDWAYTSGNLMVLVECNYGGSGTGYSSGAGFTAGNMSSNLTMLIYMNEVAPETIGNVTTVRNNIRFNMTSLHEEAIFNMNPTTLGFGSYPLNYVSPSSSVVISNSGGQDLHITSSMLGGTNPGGFIFNDTNVYPVTLPFGSTMSFSIQFHPMLVQQYNATITVTDDISREEHVLALNGEGYDTTITTFPGTESFDGTVFPPYGWLNYRIQGIGSPGTWNRQTSGTGPTCSPHSGAAMARFYSADYQYGTHAALVSPPMQLPGSNYRVKFWMYRTNSYTTGITHDEMVSVWLNSAPNLEGADSLGVIHRRTDLFPSETANGWYAYAMNFPLTSTGIKYVIFKAISCRGANMYIDDVTFEQQPVGVPDLATLVSPANNAMNQLNVISLNWVSLGTGPMVHGYYLSLGTNNPPTNIMNNIDIGQVTSYQPILQYGTTYYWKVVPYNISGQPTSSPVWSFTTKIDPTVTSFPYTQNFDTVTAPNLPIDWTTSMVCGNSSPTIRTESGLAHSAPNQVAFNTVNDVTAELILISPPTSNLGNTRIRFWARSYDNPLFIVGTMSNPTIPSSFTPFQSFQLDNFQRECSVSFAEYQGTDQYIGFTFHTQAEYDQVDFDDFTWQLIPAGPYVEVNTDTLAFRGIHNNSISTRELMITNTGFANLNYTISSSSPSVFTDAIGTQVLAPDSSRICFVSVLPTAEGNLAESITIHSDDALNPAFQIPITATVQPALTPDMIEIGNENLVDTCLPVEPYQYDSMSQTIYVQPQLNMTNCSIMSIGYEYNGSYAMSDSIKVYMGHTSKTQFSNSSDWVPASELTLVYTGLLTVPNTAGWIEIPLQLPFVYDNVHNLVVCVDKIGPWHNSECDFYCTEILSNRSIKVIGSDDYSVSNPPPGTLHMVIPNTRFQFLRLANTPICVITPSAVDFGTVFIEDIVPPVSVQVRNDGFGVLTIPQPIVLDGADASQFSLADTNTYPISLQSGQSMTVSVSFVPTSEGTKTAQLHLSDDQPLVSSRSGLQRTEHIIPLSGSSYDYILDVFPYMTGFENTIFPDSLWSVVDSANPTQGWRRRTTAGNPHTGSAYAVVGIQSGDHWLITPQFHVTSQSNKVTFWLGNSIDVPDSAVASIPEYLDVLLSTTNSDTTSFTTTLLHKTNAMIPQFYQECILDLSTYVDSVVSIAFKRHSTNGKYVYLDDLKISASGGTGISDNTTMMSSSFLLDNYPNPFNPSTIIRFYLKEKGRVVLDIYNIKGQKVITLMDGMLNTGLQSVEWNGKDNQGHPLASGIYFSQMKIGSVTHTRKMVLVK